VHVVVFDEMPAVESVIDADGGPGRVIDGSTEKRVV